MIALTHYNDGKEKVQSHEIRVTESQFYNAEHDVFSHNPFDITGYGETKREAIENFKSKFDYIMRELHAFEKLLFETSYIEDHIIEVDCCGDEIV